MPRYGAMAEADLREASGEEQKLRGAMLLTSKSFNSARIEQHRWDAIATEVRGSVANMKDQVTASLRKLVDKLGVFEESVNECKREKERAVSLGNSARDACASYFATLAEQVQAKRDLTLTDLEQQQSEKVWTLEEQVAQLQEAIHIITLAQKEGENLVSQKSELAVLDTAGLVEAHIYNAENSEAVKAGESILRPKQYAEYHSDVGVAQEGLAITSTPHFLAQTIVDWVKADKQLVGGAVAVSAGDADLRAKVRSLEKELRAARSSAGSGGESGGLRVSQLEAAVAEKDEEVLQLRTLVTSMQQEVQAASSKYTDAASNSKRISELEQLMTEAKTVLEEKLRENDSLKAQVRQLQMSSYGSAGDSSANRERAQLQGKVAELESTLAAVVREAEQKSIEAGNLRASTERLERIATESEQKLRAKDDELARAHAIGSGNQQAAMHAQQLQARVSELEMLLEAKEEAFTNVEAVAQQSASRQNQYTSGLQRQVEELKKELVLSQTALSSKQAENDGYQARMAQLQARVSELQSSSQSAHDEVLAARARTKQLEGALSSLDHEKDELQRESAEHGGKAKMLVSKIKELQAALDGKAKELQEAQEMRKEAVLVAARLKRSSTKAAEDLQKLREQISQMGAVPRV